MPSFPPNAAGTGGPPYPLGPPHQGHANFAQLMSFWQSQLQEIQSLGPEDLKNHQLPLARIKKIMKSDEDVRMISAEAPVLFSKACEMFILELTLRAWFQSEENKRRTLQRSDIAAAITSTDVFDFLVDIVPREETREVPDQARLPQPYPAVAGLYPYFPAGPYRPVGTEGAMVGPTFPVPVDAQTLMYHNAHFLSVGPQQWPQVAATGSSAQAANGGADVGQENRG